MHKKLQWFHRAYFISGIPFVILRYIFHTITAGRENVKYKVEKSPARPPMIIISNRPIFTSNIIKTPHIQKFQPYFNNEEERRKAFYSDFNNSLTFC